ncbi:PE-PGRS family protein [Streptomyces sp. NPDC006530]|uniref:PE-PGRS family protein n=1 Tax=Streptomyces sp. NPDC006530 TaxID=3364750 RepID=UPI0036AEB361
MRNVNPEDLEQIGTLVDGRSGVGDKLKEAFTRASNLGVSSRLATLKPLNSWVTEQGPDFRRRAAVIRLDGGDPEAGLLWAGFSSDELRKYDGKGLTPDVLLLANSVAASDDPHAKGFARQDGEAVADWIDRMKAHALAQIPGLQPHEQTIETLIGLFGEWKDGKEAALTVTVQAGALTTVLVKNSLLESGQLRTWKIRVGAILRGSSNGRIRTLGNGLVKWEPALKSLSAPGSWLPSKIASWAGATGRIPFADGQIGTRTGGLYNLGRSLPFMRQPIWRGLSVNSLINGLVGNDTLAARFGGFTHSGQAVSRAANASLLKVGANIFTRGRAVGWGRGLALAKGVAGAGKVAGAMRGIGVVGGLWSTYLAGDQLYHRGLPWEHGNFSTREKGARYVANVAEVGFNASLTAATVAPNPFTIGATVVFGAVYVGAKVVEHWDGIKAGAGKAVHAVGDAVKDPVGTAKKVGHALNPKNWF